MDVTPEFKDPYHEALFWRGTFIQGYAGFEHGVTELLLRASDHRLYHSLGVVPWKWDSKSKRLVQLLKMPGPLLPYAGEIKARVQPITALERYRHILVHGIMHQMVENGAAQLTFKFHDHKDKAVYEWLYLASLIEFREMAVDLVCASDAFGRLLGKVFQEAQLSAVPVGNRILIEPEPRKL